MPAGEDLSFGASETWFPLEGGLLLGRQGMCNFFSAFSILLEHSDTTMAYEMGRN